MKKNTLILVMICLTMFFASCAHEHEDYYSDGQQSWSLNYTMDPTYEDDPQTGFWEGEIWEKETKKFRGPITFEFFYNLEGYLEVSLLDPIKEKKWHRFTIGPKNLEDGLFSYNSELSEFTIYVQLTSETSATGYLCTPENNGDYPLFFEAEWARDFEYYLH